MTASPQGEALKKAEPVIRAKKSNKYAPHQSTMLTASPRGEAAKGLTIFAEENEGTEFSAGKGKPFLLIYICVTPYYY